MTRGIERFARTPVAWLAMRVAEPTGFVITRKMLLNLKDRAERLHLSNGSHQVSVTAAEETAKARAVALNQVTA